MSRKHKVHVRKTHGACCCSTHSDDGHAKIFGKGVRGNSDASSPSVARCCQVHQEPERKPHGPPLHADVRYEASLVNPLYAKIRKLRRRNEELEQDIDALVRKLENALDEVVNLQQTVLKARDLVDQGAELRAYAERRKLGIHFCDNWDGLLIGPGDVEFEECCPHREKLTK